MNKSLIIKYLHSVKHVPRQQLIDDLQSIGLKIRGASPDGRFIEFVNKHGQVRVKLHASDKVTHYNHMHIIDNKGRSLSNRLQVVNRRSSDAHIEIQ